MLYLIGRLRILFIVASELRQVLCLPFVEHVGCQSEIYVFGTALGFVILNSLTSSFSKQLLFRGQQVGDLQLLCLSGMFLVCLYLLLLGIIDSLLSRQV